jgi:hypothetical protein
VGAQVLGKHPSNHFRLPLNSFVRRLQRTGPYSILIEQNPVSSEFQKLRAKNPYLARKFRGSKPQPIV